MEVPTNSSGSMLELLKELEAMPQGESIQEVETDPAKGSSVEDGLQITLSDPITEVFPATEGDSWERVQQYSHHTIDKPLLEDASLVVSPSRFSPLMDIEEEGVEGEEEDVEAVVGGSEMEEGEITGEVGRPSTRASSGIKKPPASSNHQKTKQRVFRAKDLKFVGRQGTSKKTSVRKL